jgi:hypothetical protein
MMMQTPPALAEVVTMPPALLSNMPPGTKHKFESNEGSVHIKSMQ